MALGLYRLRFKGDGVRKGTGKIKKERYGKKLRRKGTGMSDRRNRERGLFGMTLNPALSIVLLTLRNALSGIRPLTPYS